MRPAMGTSRVVLDAALERVSSENRWPAVLKPRLGVERVPKQSLVQWESRYPVGALAQDYRWR